jgi:hypothetical protein
MQLNPTQRNIFDSLLSIGVDRPIMLAEELDKLHKHVEQSLKPILANWSSNDLWFNKSTLATLNKCEGLIQAQALVAQSDKINYSKQIVIGTISHYGIQLHYTHKNHSIETYIRSAIDHLSMDDAAFQRFWLDCNMVTQSEILATATSRIANFIDSFPPLEQSWTPRFEEGHVVKIGKLRLSARPDLTLGRPKADGKQTMFLIDFKSGSLNPEHENEAGFYALVLSLKNHIAPFRSLVFSLSENQFTKPDVTIESLEKSADYLVNSVKKYVEIFTEKRLPVYTPGSHCTWCPVKETCELSSHSLKS